ncbi:MAG: protein-tyrosine phosphatase family protein [Thiolinea sp.]
METEIFAVKSIGPGELFIMPCPIAALLPDTLQTLQQQGITKLVSLLEHDEAEKLGMADEAAACAQAGLDFEQFPIPDHQIPADNQAFQLLSSQLYQELQDGAKLAIHCYAGIGRAGLLAGSLLIRDGMNAGAAAELLSDRRGFMVPQTRQQYLYLLDLEQAERGENSKASKDSRATSTHSLPERLRNWFIRRLSPA